MDDVEVTMDSFIKQCRGALQDIEELKLTPIEEINELNICAMGASAFGYHIVKSLFEKEMRIPILLHNDYVLPDFINNRSLIFLISYSGTTEEVINMGRKAYEHNANIFGITKKESALGKMLFEKKSVFYNIIPTHNPSNQPRMASGYTITGLIAMFCKLGLINIDLAKLSKTFDLIESNLPQLKNSARVIAARLAEKQIIIIGAEHLGGNCHVLRNQLNESAKNFASYNLLPELNHHLLEGLKHPASFCKNTEIFLLNSHLYSDNTKLRSKLTTDIVKKNNLNIEIFTVMGDDKITQVYSMLAFGGYLSYHLAIANKEDPKNIPWVNYFKENLKNCP